MSRPSPLTRAIEVLGEGEAQAEDDGLRPQHLPRRCHLLLQKDSCDLAQLWGTPNAEGNLGAPRGVCPSPPHANAAGDAMGTHIEEADVHVEVNVHVVNGPVLPVKTRGTMVGEQGETGTVPEPLSGAHCTGVGMLAGR